MANLNLGHDVANKRKKIDIAVHVVAKLSPVAVASSKNAWYGSLVNINPSNSYVHIWACL